MSPIQPNPTKKHKRKLTSGLNLPSSNLSHQLFTISVHRHATCITNFQPFLSPGKMGETTSHPKWIKPKDRRPQQWLNRLFAQVSCFNGLPRVPGWLWFIFKVIRWCYRKAFKRSWTSIYVLCLLLHDTLLVFVNTLELNANKSSMTGQVTSGTWKEDKYDSSIKTRTTKLHKYSLFSKTQKIWPKISSWTKNAT